MVARHHAGSAGDAAKAVSHEGCALLVADPNEAKVVTVVKRVEDIEERGTDDPEDVGHPFPP